MHCQIFIWVPLLGLVYEQSVISDEYRVYITKVCIRNSKLLLVVVNYPRPYRYSHNYKNKMRYGRFLRKEYLHLSGGAVFEGPS